MDENDQATQEERPSLHSLCQRQTPQSYARARQLLEDPLTSLDALDKNGMTPLHVAVVNKNASGASVNARDVHGKSVLHTAVRQGSPMVGLLVDRGASVVCPESKYGRTPIHIAAELGATEILETLLWKCSKGADIKDKKDMTPLHFAAERGHRNCCHVLLRHGANPSAKNRCNETALHIAVRNCYLLTSQILLSYEHDLNSKDNNGFTPLIRITTCKKFDAEKVLCLLLERRPDLNATCPNGDTALHHAVKGGSQDKCRILVEAGVDCNVQNKHGMTPLHIAAKKKLPECCAAILRLPLRRDLLELEQPGLRRAGEPQERRRRREEPAQPRREHGEHSGHGALHED
ncbi:ankyrin repeat, PH and SEC7 domain containing protein secG-like isoform X2 [Penaeus monodon]|uniref:ankyrin repeat, PH and SEC7 domain containing protein secG-like isoform X2 n=1 Tax=Penaeus monodon TaxID=6687 RepID=UPI0018A7B68A|nr:ankyrin repeat, PH and SEC7 domain containing protein secG-like isoform X2 [Penaeus monodon]